MVILIYQLIEMPIAFFNVRDILSQIWIWCMYAKQTYYVHWY